MAPWSRWPAAVGVWLCSTSSGEILVHGPAEVRVGSTDLLSDGGFPRQSLAASSIAHKFCEASEADYQAMPLCEEQNKDYWRKKGGNSTGDCYYDEEKRKIVCSQNSKCSGFGEVKDEVRGVTEIYDCTECDFRVSKFNPFSKKNKVLRVGCCNVCRNRKEVVGIRSDGERINMVVCKGCANEELEKIREENKEICTRDEATGRFHCNSDAKPCEVGVVSVDDKKTLCQVSPCGECPDNSLARAQCCLQCLEHTCDPWDFGQQVKQVCTGCGDGDFPPDEDDSVLNPGSGGFWVFIIIVLVAIAAAGAGFYALYTRRNPALQGRGDGGGAGQGPPALPAPSNPAVGDTGRGLRHQQTEGAGRHLQSRDLAAHPPTQLQVFLHPATLHMWR